MEKRCKHESNSTRFAVRRKKKRVSAENGRTTERTNERTHCMLRNEARHSIVFPVFFLLLLLLFLLLAFAQIERATVECTYQTHTPRTVRNEIGSLSYSFVDCNEQILGLLLSLVLDHDHTRSETHTHDVPTDDAEYVTITFLHRVTRTI